MSKFMLSMGLGLLLFAISSGAPAVAKDVGHAIAGTPCTDLGDTGHSGIVLLGVESPCAGPVGDCVSVQCLFDANRNLVWTIVNP